MLYMYMNVYLMNRVENIGTNGEIYHHEQFLNLSQCFQKSSAVETSLIDNIPRAWRETVVTN